MPQAEFDNLAKFVAVAEELSQEPFFSDDNHDTLPSYTGPDGKPVYFGQFGHPAFLKSAVLPFRKLWMPTEPCCFTRIRDLFFDFHAGEPKIEGYRYWFYDHYDRTLADSPYHPASSETAQDFLDIWINTQGAHTGRRLITKRGKKGKSLVSSIGRFDLADFDVWLSRLGRARFEFMFRSSLRIVGSLYVKFCQDFARPWYVRLCDEQHMRASFEVSAALHAKAYASVRDNVFYDDPFWHGDKEQITETFERLLGRHQYQPMGNLLRALFSNAERALRYTLECEDMETLLHRIGAEVLEVVPANRDDLLVDFASPGDFNMNGGRVIVLRPKVVHFGERSRRFMGELFGIFRSEFVAQRETIDCHRKVRHWDRDRWHGVDHQRGSDN